jgi:SAM-dependent methyltransferase
MTTPDPGATDAAQAYETSLVPALMEEWAPRLVAAARIQAGDQVLDVACGTGVLTRAVAARVGSTGSVAGLDLDPGMLAVARARRPDLEWMEGSAEQLPYPDASFDAVVSQFGLMFFPDKPAAIAEMWRVLRPGGRMAVAVWASLDATPAYDRETRLIEQHAGPRASAPLRLPFTLGDRGRFEAQFTEAGVPLDTITTVVGAGRFPSIRAMVAADVIGWLPVMGVQLEPGVVEAILREAEDVLAEYRQQDGTVVFDSPAHIAVAVRAALSRHPTAP